MEKWKINSRQFKILVLNCYIGASIIISPGTLAVEAKQDAWIGAIIAGIIGIIIVLFLNYMGDVFSNMTIVEYTNKLLGNWTGKIISSLFVLYLFIECATLVYDAGTFFATQILISTPIEVIHIITVIILVIATRLGLETFARSAEIFYPYLLLFIVLLILFILKDVDIVRIQPVFEHGFKASFRGGMLLASFSSLTFAVMFMIFPAYVNNTGKAKRAFLSAVILGSVMTIIVTILSILVLGPDLTARNTYPIYALAKKISIANFLERIEVMLAVIWMISIFYKTLLFYFGSVIGLSQILNLKDYRPLTMPMAMILIVLSLVIFPNVVYANNWYKTVWIPFISTFSIVLPMVLLTVSKIEKYKKKNK